MAIRIMDAMILLMFILSGEAGGSCLEVFAIGTAKGA